jgi:hypothetical protein
MNIHPEHNPGQSYCARKALTDRLQEWSDLDAYRDTLTCQGPFEEMHQTAARSGLAPLFPVCRPTAPIEFPVGAEKPRGAPHVTANAPFSGPNAHLPRR